MRLRKFTISTITGLLLVTPFTNLMQNVHAATFTNVEINQVHHFQKQYADLDKTDYNINNLYSQVPHLTAKFDAGKVKDKYINDQLDYINYYRAIFGLPAVTLDKVSNENAQKTAAVMAAIDANPFVNQHGLPTDTRPDFIDKSIWKLAQDTSEASNLNFNVNDQSAGEVITDLLTDRYNLTGSDTGHRAWLLSTRLTSTGIGAAYGNNGYRYSVQKVLNIDDLFKTASQPTIAYPSSGLFPIELIKGKNIAWSLYLSNKVVNDMPKIKITDDDTKQTYSAKQIQNYSSAGYGNFKTVITYSPGKCPIIVGHQYHIKIGDLYDYHFKLFKQSTTTSVMPITQKATTYQRASSQDNSNLKATFSSQSAKLWATLNPKSKINSSYNHFDALKRGQWKHNFFIRYALKDNT